jgi:sporulation protein YlmC with PRC-barrel domain
VEATDGRVGRIEEFLVDQVTWNVTHLVLQEGHLWERRELIIPISHVDRVEKDTIFLKNDKKTIESFSALTVER